MLILYSKLIGKSVGTLKEGFLIGKIADIVFDPNQLKIDSIVFRSGSFSLRDKFEIISFAEIIKIFKGGVFVNDIDSLTPLDENPKVKKLADEKYFGTGQIVIDENRKLIGRVFDFVIDTETGAIIKVYTRHFFKERIIDSQNIKEIKKKIVIVKSNSAKILVEEKAAKPVAS